MKKLIGILATIVLACCGGIPIAIALALSESEGSLSLSGACRAASGATETAWDAEQLENARIIHGVAVSRDLPTRAAVIAIATAMQESTLHNYGHLGENNDHDSLGLFQQRPSAGWGTPEEIMDPVYATNAFLDKLIEIDGWETLPLTVAAQKVQVSAYPDAYAKWEPDAVDLVASFGSGVPCVALGEVSSTGWTVPVTYGVVSGFRTSERPSHDGVDLGAPRDTPIVAAAAGTVITSECNASLHGGAYSCDIDGSPEVAGCGWYVNIAHAGGMITRYCHMTSQPLVKVGDPVQVGQVLGYVGSSGRSSGPHLHYEVHQNNDRSSSGAISPVMWHLQQAAPIAGTEEK